MRPLIILALAATLGCGTLGIHPRTRGMDPDRAPGLFVRTPHALVCGDLQEGTVKRVTVWATITGRRIGGARARARITRFGEDGAYQVEFTPVDGVQTWTVTFPAGAGPSYKVEFWAFNAVEEVYGYTTAKVYYCGTPGSMPAADLSDWEGR